MVFQVQVSQIKTVSAILHAFLADAKFKCHSKIDMVILLDSSASVTEETFNATKKFAAELIKHFDISKDRTNVAVMSFSQYVHTERNFNDDTSEQSVMKAIDGLTYEGSFTRLDFALQRIQDETFNEDHGARYSNKGTLLHKIFATLYSSSLRPRFKLS